MVFRVPQRLRLPIKRAGNVVERVAMMRAAVLLVGALGALTHCSTPRTAPDAPRLGQLAAWVVDWDMDAGLDELHRHEDLFDEVGLFGVRFDADDRLLIPPAVQEGSAKLLAWRRGGSRAVWLTVVNDRQLDDGTFSHKDPDLVDRLLADGGAQHARDLVGLLARMDVDGLELDYEDVSADSWPRLLRFADSLRDRLISEGKDLRLITQPRRPYLDLKSAGTPVAIMAYNLYGTHSGPGPKTTPEFVTRLGQALDDAGVLPGARIALPTGGFLWRPGGETRSVTEVEALLLQSVDGAGRLRRTPYEYPFFSVAEGDDGRSEIWYQDAASIEGQIVAALAAGFDEITLWRLGGNDDTLFEMLRGYRQPSAPTRLLGDSARDDQKRNRNVLQKRRPM